MNNFYQTHRINTNTPSESSLENFKALSINTQYKDIKAIHVGYAYTQREHNVVLDFMQIIRVSAPGHTDDRVNILEIMWFYETNMWASFSLSFVELRLERTKWVWVYYLLSAHALYVFSQSFPGKYPVLCVKNSILTLEQVCEVISKRWCMKFREFSVVTVGEVGLDRVS